ncbi:MAG: hypothetical protein HEQ37_01165 [Acidovorax sp.]|nr:hypothetical protein [Acidovorax sp.]
MLLFEHANDHGGTWRDDLGELLQRCTAPPGLRGQSAAMPASQACTFTMLKPLHSAFHSTALEHLLRAMETRNLAGVRLSSGMCVQMTAMDAGTHARIQAMGTVQRSQWQKAVHTGKAVLYPLARSCSCAMRKDRKAPHRARRGAQQTPFVDHARAPSGGIAVV